MSEHGQQRPRVNTTVLFAGAVTALVGLLLMGIGSSLAAGAVASAARRWVRQLESPPRETAKLKLRQLRTAASAGTSAGATAWRSAAPASGTHGQ